MDLKGIRILAVDDTPDIRLILRSFFGAYGAVVTTAADGVEAVSLFQAHPFDVVILDLHMPHRDGFETLRQMRKHNSRTPIVAFSAYEYDEGGRHSLEHGFNSFVTKGQGVTLLAEQLKKVLTVSAPPPDHRGLPSEPPSGPV